MRSEGYSLWFTPRGKNYNKFSSLIKRLAKKYGGPVFEPHITLLGEIILPEEEIIKRVKKLVSGQKPFIINLKDLGYEDFHFRALFVRAEITPQLQALHDKAREIFSMDIPAYMAHLSLLYGKYPNELKEKIMDEVGRDHSAQLKVNSVVLKKGGEVKDWNNIKEFYFQ